jgi:hypothetical protein
MLAAVDTLIARLEVECPAAEAAERAVRASVEEQPWTPWTGVGFFAGLGHAGGQLPNVTAVRKLKEVEADVKVGLPAFNRRMFLDREGRHLHVDGATA